MCVGEDEDVLEDEEPELDTVLLQHPAPVNRIKVSDYPRDDGDIVTHSPVGCSPSFTNHRCHVV